MLEQCKKLIQEIKIKEVKAQVHTEELQQSIKKNAVVIKSETRNAVTADYRNMGLENGKCSRGS